MLCNCLRREGPVAHLTEAVFLMGFISSWLMLLNWLAVLLRESHCKERTDLRWLELPESHTLGQRQGLCESCSLNCFLLVRLWKGPYSTTLFQLQSCSSMLWPHKYVTGNRVLLCKHNNIQLLFETSTALQR